MEVGSPPETSESCPTCGQPVQVVTGDEGTSHYAPVQRYTLPRPPRRRTELEELLADEFELVLDEAEDAYKDSPVGGRKALIAALQAAVASIKGEGR